MRKHDVAQLAGVPIAQVQLVDVATVRRALADRVPATVLDVATQEPASYWLAGGHYYLDDPFFGGVADIEQLGYSSDIGLHVRCA